MLKSIMSTFAMLAIPCRNFFFICIKKSFKNSSVCDYLLRGTILSLFKGKGAKANNKDNYRGITLIPSLQNLRNGAPQQT